MAVNDNSRKVRPTRGGRNHYVNNSVSVATAGSNPAPSNPGSKWKRLIVKEPEKSELRKRFEYVIRWIEDGMKTTPSTAFTEGDLRLAAELCQVAVDCERLRKAIKKRRPKD